MRLGRGKQLENLTNIVPNSKLDLVAEPNMLEVGVEIDKDMKLVTEFAEESVPRVDVTCQWSVSALIALSRYPTLRHADMMSTAEVVTALHC